MDADAHERATRLATRQHGAISLAQAKECGLTLKRIVGLVERGAWIRQFAGVFRIAGAPSDRRQQLQLAALWMPESAALSHFAAAEIWRVKGIPKRTGVDLITGATTRVPPKCWFEIRAHRSRDFEPAFDRSRIDGFWITRPARTLLDLAPLVTEDQLEVAVLDFIRRDLIDRKVFRAELDGFGEGVRRIDVLRRLIGTEHTKNKTDSPLEILVLQMITSAGLPAPKPQVTVHDGEIRIGTFDFAYEEQRLVIECDGRDAHDRSKAFHSDREKDNKLAAIGWRILRITSPMVNDRRDETVELIRRTLATPLGTAPLQRLAADLEFEWDASLNPRVQDAMAQRAARRAQRRKRS